MADSTLNVPFTVSAPTQPQADAIRDNAVTDYCIAYNLDIYQEDGVTLDQAKVLAAFRSHLRQHVKSVVVAFRASSDAETAKQASIATNETEIG